MHTKPNKLETEAKATERKDELKKFALKSGSSGLHRTLKLHPLLTSSKTCFNVLEDEFKINREFYVQTVTSLSSRREPWQRAWPK